MAYNYSKVHDDFQENSMRLANKHAVITGGSGGIGLATVLKFLAEGASISIWDVNPPAEAAIPPNRDVQFIQVNVADPESVKNACQQTVDRSGKIDILVNNAGITADSQLIKWKNGEVAGQMSADAFDRVLQVNLYGVFHCTQAVIPTMITQGGGVILSAASVVGLYGNFGQTNYVATKAGVIGMTRTWARELGRYQIRVNAVAPGFILTDMVKKMPPDVLKEMEKHTPLGRLGTPEDVANLYTFLASDEASYIHGAVLSVDGGLVPGT
jgi:3-oxoacyl-[acyl-carrier protein] reductase